jgi:hypothetical protein
MLQLKAKNSIATESALESLIPCANQSIYDTQSIFVTDAHADKYIITPWQAVSEDVNHSARYGVHCAFRIQALPQMAALLGFLALMSKASLSTSELSGLNSFVVAR